jgi:hypothetical protein
VKVARFDEPLLPLPEAIALPLLELVPPPGLPVDESNHPTYQIEKHRVNKVTKPRVHQSFLLLLGFSISFKSLEIFCLMFLASFNGTVVILFIFTVLYHQAIQLLNSERYWT